MHRFPLLALLVITLAPALRAQEITDARQRRWTIGRIASAYYDLRAHGLISAECDVHPSIVEDLDTLLRGRGVRKEQARRALRAVTPRLHIEPGEKPWIVTSGSARTGDAALDSVVDRSLAWASGLLVAGVDAWRTFADGGLSARNSPADTGCTIFVEGSGLRVRSARVEMTLDSAFRVNSYTTTLPNGGAIVSVPRFDSTSEGLVLRSIEASVPGAGVTSRVTVEVMETDGVLLPSRIVAFTARRSPLASGNGASGGTTITFLLTRHRVRKG